MRESPIEQPILFYDGECKFCSTIVDFVLRHERDNQLRFCWLQSSRAQDLLTEHKVKLDLSTVMLIDNGKLYTHSDAALRLSTYIKRPYRAARHLRILPRGLRDGVYRWIAMRRKKIMGSMPCTLPIGLEDRFLD